MFKRVFHSPHRKRKYPIKPDEMGRSARARAFELFDKGLQPPQIPGMVEVSLRTARRYYADWKDKPYTKGYYDLVKMLLGRKSPVRDMVIGYLASIHGVPKSEMERWLERPGGLKRVLDKASGERKAEVDKRCSQAETHLVSALKLIYTYHLCGVPLEHIEEALDRLARTYTRPKRKPRPQHSS